MITPKSRLIVALDVTDRKEALDIVAKLGPAVDAVKVNYPLEIGRAHV
jgi:orotidine-5'-phosphate decarboxylase